MEDDIKTEKFLKYEWDNFNEFRSILIDGCLEKLDDDEKNDLKKKLYDCESSLERVDCLLQNVKLLKLLNDQVPYFLSKLRTEKQKNNRLVITNTRNGDRYFKFRDYIKSLKYYNRAILYYSDDLLKSNNEKSFLNSENLCFKINMEQLLIKRAKVFERLDCAKEAKLDLLEAKKLNENLNLCNLNFTDKILKADTEILKFDIPSENTKLKGSTSAVRMEYSTEKGRLIFSNKDINEGEIIFFEEPFSHWLRPSLYNFYCNHCLNPLTNWRFLPCKVCNIVKYCSSQCRDIAYNRYHKIECFYLPILLKWPLGHMSFRLVIRDGIEQTLKEDSQESVPFEKWPELVFSSDYKSMRSLTGENIFNGPEYNCSFVFGCVMIGLLMEKTNLINLKQLKQFCSVLIKSLLQITENTFMIYDYDIKPADEIYNYDLSFWNAKNLKKQEKLLVISNETNKIGVGIYSSASLVSHSCDNNTDKYYIGSSILIVSSKFIPANSEVSIEYGTHYKINSLKDRQSFLLKNFGFQCKCLACEKGLENVGFSFRCPKCNQGAIIRNSDESNYCTNCKSENINLNELDELSSEGFEYFKNGISYYCEKSLKNAQIELKNCERIFSKLYFNQEKSNYVKYTLSHVYFECGDYKLSYKYLLETLAYCKDIHGERTFKVLSYFTILIILLLKHLKSEMKIPNKMINNFSLKRYFLKLFQKFDKEQHIWISGKNELVFKKSDEYKNIMKDLKRNYFEMKNLCSILSKRQVKIVASDDINLFCRMKYIEQNIDSKGEIILDELKKENEPVMFE